MKTARISLLIAILLLCSAPAFGFGAATHTYIARQLGDDYGFMNLQEMYGAVLPDMFNLMFGEPYQDYLWNETHYEFMKVVDSGWFGRRKAMVFGFASHNEPWGADAAHFGYIGDKTDLLAASVEDYVAWVLLIGGAPDAEALAEELTPVVAESAVESAIDLLIARNEDPQIGIRMLAAAAARGPFVPRLLCRAYARDFAEHEGISVREAGRIIRAVERQFRQSMELYGVILSLGDPLDAMAEQGAEIAEQLLASQYGVDIDVPSSVMAYLLETAIEVVEADYAVEIEAAITRVATELDDHDIETAGF